MSSDAIKSFLVELGYKGDPAGAKKMAEEAAKVEAAVTKSAAEGAAKREAIESGAATKRIGLAAGLGKIISELEQHRAEREAKIRADEAARDEKLQTERERKAKERRDRAVRDLRQHATAMATFALKLVGGVEATALGIVVAVDRASRSMERLGYMSQRAGSTPGKMTATGYAFSQTGGTAESGQAAVAALGEKLKTPGYDRVLKSIGVEAHKANGALRDTGDILADLGEALAKQQKQGGAAGYRTAQAYAETFGLDVDQMQTIEDPRYKRMYAERQAIDAKMGTDEGAGAEAGSKFETSMRRLEATIDSLKTKVATDLAKNIQPTLDKLADWAVEHGEQISNVVVKIADGIVSFAASFTDHLSKVNWDAIIKDVSDFGDTLNKRMTELFGDDGKMVLALAGFAAAVSVKVLGPLGAVLRTLNAIGALPLVGRLLGGGLSLAKGAAGAAGGAAVALPAIGALAVGGVLASGDPNKAMLDGGRPDVQSQDNDLGLPGVGDRPVDTSDAKGKAASAWSWLKTTLGIGGGPDDKRVKDAILQTAEGVKKLADKTDGMGGPSVNVGGGSNLGHGAPNLRYGRQSGEGGRQGRYRSTPIPDAPYNGKNIDGLDEGATKQYAAILGNRESGNRYGITNPYGYVGRWQMGADALAENGYVKPGTTNRGLNDPSNWTGKGGVHSVEEFKANKGGVQDQEFGEYTNRHYAQLKAAGVIRDGMTKAEVAGWLAAAHLKGVGGAISLSRGHDNVDANGTSASSYRRMMAGVGVGTAAPTAPTVGAGTPAPSAKAITDAEVFAARQRIINGSRDPKDRALVDRYKAEQARPNDKPIKVDVTDQSALKIGRGIDNGHLAATQAVLRAHRGQIMGVDPHSTLGRHIRHSIDASRRSITITHNPSYTMHGVADPAAALSDAHRLAGRGQADLIRNLSTMTS